MSRHILILFLMLFLKSVMPSFSEESSLQNNPGVTQAKELSYPFVGVVVGEKVNVRSGGNVNFEILSQVSQGQEVVVLSRADDWYQVQPPQGTPLWVYQKYVEGHQITADSVNVRSRPGLEGSINLQLRKNDLIEPLGLDGEWLRIQAPSKAKTWIHQDYVKFSRPFTVNEKSTPEAKLTHSQELKDELDAIQKDVDLEMFKPMNEIQIEPLVSRYQKLTDENPEDGELHDEIERRVADLRGREVKMVPKEKEAVQDLSSTIILVKDESTPPLNGDVSGVQENQILTPIENVNLEKESGLEIPEDVHPPHQDVSQEGVREQSFEINRESLSKVVRNYDSIFEGKVEVFGFGRDRKYKLIQNRRRVCIFSGIPEKVDPYLRQEVKIKGNIVDWIYPRIPVLELVEIEEIGYRS